MLDLEASKRGKRNRNKGSAYERKIASLLMGYFPECILVRTPSSGGFQKQRKVDIVRGDISNLNDEIDFKMHIECKDTSTWKPKDWFKQANADCPSGKIPTVCMHWQQETGVAESSEDYIMLRTEDFLRLVDRKRIALPKGIPGMKKAEKGDRS